MLRIMESLRRMAKASSMPWYGHVLKEDENVIVKAFNFEVSCSKERRRLKQTRKKAITFLLFICSNYGKVL